MRIDARGLRCPWPVLRAARAMRDHGAVAIEADDPAAPGELRALCIERGWTLATGGADAPFLFRINDPEWSGRAAS